jgi:Family of unknown function (DUF6510)
MALDGNALGGLLLEIFGTEMTSAQTTCATCGAVRPVAETTVYLRAPGAVARCRRCASVLMVIVRVRGLNCVDLTGLEALRPTAQVTDAPGPSDLIHPQLMNQPHPTSLEGE